MEVRPIDAVQVVNDINLHHRPIPVSEFDFGFNYGLNQAMWEIANAPTLTPPNEALTLEELRKIDTVIPLWVHNLSWGQHKLRLMLIRHVTSNYWSCVDFDGFETIKSDDYGSRYLIYRRPPEGEEEEKHVIEITENL